MYTARTFEEGNERRWGSISCTVSLPSLGSCQVSSPTCQLMTSLWCTAAFVGMLSQSVPNRLLKQAEINSSVSPLAYFIVLCSTAHLALRIARTGSRTWQMRDFEQQQLEKCPHQPFPSTPAAFASAVRGKGAEKEQFRRVDFFTQSCNQISVRGDEIKSLQEEDEYQPSFLTVKQVF